MSQANSTDPQKEFHIWKVFAPSVVGFQPFALSLPFPVTLAYLSFAFLVKLFNP